MFWEPIKNNIWNDTRISLEWPKSARCSLDDIVEKLDGVAAPGQIILVGAEPVDARAENVCPSPSMYMPAHQDGCSGRIMSNM